jgi:hemerythrin-like domain-containing protein
VIAAAGYLPLLLERLSRDHARIAGVVKRLADLAEELESAPDWNGVAELIDFLDYYADKVHHPLEDRVFDYLLNKGLTPTERHLVFKNLGQHEEITEMTSTLERQAAAAAAGTLIDVSEFYDRLQNYIALQKRHMRFEEHQLFPLLDQGLDNSDWNALTKSVGSPEQDESKAPAVI